MTAPAVHSSLAVDPKAAKRAYDRARYLAKRAERDAARPADPITALDDPTLAYLAGLTDADGSIFVTHTNRLRTYYPAICWAMIHKPTIEWVAEMLGGCPVYLHNQTNLRRGRTTWGPSKFKEQWRTGLNGGRAQLLCTRLIPFMHTKVEQARLVSVFPVDNRRAPGLRLDDEVRMERERLGREISALNRG